MSFEIQNFGATLGNPSVLGEFDLYHPPWNMTIRKLKVVRSKKGHLFVSFPSYCEKLDNGEKKFHPYIEFSEQKNKDFQKAILELLQPYLGANSQI